MTRNPGRRPLVGASTGGRPRRHEQRPAVEPLEGRPLLSSFFAGPTATRPVQSAGGVYTLTMSGPGLEKVRQVGHGQIAVTLFGTTPSSTLNVALTRPRLHTAAAPLQIASIRVASGQLGGIQGAGAAILNGPISPLNGQVNTLQFAGLGPNAQIDVNGPLGSLSVAGGVALGPAGHVNIAGDIGQGLSVGALNLAGGRFVVGHDIAGPLNLGAVGLSQGGQFLVGHDVKGAAQVVGNMSVATNGLFSVGHNLVGGLSVGQNLALDSGGQVSVGNDLTGPINVGGGLTVTNGARLIVNRDVTGTVTVSGDLSLASGGTLVVNRTLNALTVNGNLSVAPAGSGITVGGDLNTLTVDGAFVGQSSSKAADLTVGLNLGALNVLGGGADQGGLQGANINVAKSIIALNVAHGMFYSLITAGVSIDGGTPAGGAGANIGPDGTDALLNSEILAGFDINNLKIGGDVRSTFATNPASAGYRTRIVAGETLSQAERQNYRSSYVGDYSNGGLIDHFQITGSLIDSVIAASVAPYGDSGTYPSSAYGAPAPAVGAPPGDGGFNTYDPPAGTTTGGTVGKPVAYQNFSELSYKNEMLTGVTYNTAIDPTIDDTILFGAINPSYASPPLSQATLSGSTTVTSNQGTSTSGTTQTTTVTANDQVLPLPTTSTVQGGVISTVHGDEADFAGLFAADTRGVFIGSLPS